MQCEHFKGQLEEYLSDGLDEGQRLEFRRHLCDCPECRDWAVAEEPTLFLMFASSAGASDQDRAGVDRCVTAVGAMIRQDRLVGHLGRRRQPWWYAAAAVAVMGLTVGLWWAGSNESNIAHGSEELTAQAEQVEEGPKVEFQMEGEGVRVYHLADDEDTAVWFVINPELES